MLYNVIYNNGEVTKKNSKEMKNFLSGFGEKETASSRGIKKIVCQASQREIEQGLDKVPLDKKINVPIETEPVSWHYSEKERNDFFGDTWGAKALTGLFPSIAENYMNGETGTFQNILGGIKDVASLPGRGLMSLQNDDRYNLGTRSEDIDDVEPNGIFDTGAKFVQEIGRDPINAVFAGTGSAIGAPVRGALKVASKTTPISYDLGKTATNFERIGKTIAPKENSVLDKAAEFVGKGSDKMLGSSLGRGVAATGAAATIGANVENIDASLNNRENHPVAGAVLGGLFTAVPEAIKKLISKHGEKLVRATIEAMQYGGLKDPKRPMTDDEIATFLSNGENVENLKRILDKETQGRNKLPFSTGARAKTINEQAQLEKKEGVESMTGAQNEVLVNRTNSLELSGQGVHGNRDNLVQIPKTNIKESEFPTDDISVWNKDYNYDLSKQPLVLGTGSKIAERVETPSGTTFKPVSDEVLQSVVSGEMYTPKMSLLKPKMHDESIMAHPENINPVREYQPFEQKPKSPVNRTATEKNIESFHDKYDNIHGGVSKLFSEDITPEDKENLLLLVEKRSNKFAPFPHPGMTKDQLSVPTGETIAGYDQKKVSELIGRIKTMKSANDLTKEDMTYLSAICARGGGKAGSLYKRISYLKSINQMSKKEQAFLDLLSSELEKDKGILKGYSPNYAIEHNKFLDDRTPFTSAKLSKAYEDMFTNGWQPSAEFRKRLEQLTIEATKTGNEVSLPIKENFEKDPALRDKAFINMPEYNQYKVYAGYRDAMDNFADGLNELVKKRTGRNLRNQQADDYIVQRDNMINYLSRFLKIMQENTRQNKQLDADTIVGLAEDMGIRNDEDLNKLFTKFLKDIGTPKEILDEFAKKSKRIAQYTKVGHVLSKQSYDQGDNPFQGTNFAPFYPTPGINAPNLMSYNLGKNSMVQDKGKVFADVGGFPYTLEDWASPMPKKEPRFLEKRYNLGNMLLQGATGDRDK